MGVTRSWERSVTKTSSRMQVVTLSEPAIAGPFLHSANRSRVPRAHPCQQDKHLRFVDSLSVVLLAVQGYLLHDLRLCRRTNSKRLDQKQSSPSLVTLTLGGITAETSPSWVSTSGKAVHNSPLLLVT